MRITATSAIAVDGIDMAQAAGYIDEVLGDGGHAAGAGVGDAAGGGVLPRPAESPVIEAEAGENVLFLIDAVHEKDFAADDGGTAVSFVEVAFPEDFGAGFVERPDDFGFEEGVVLLGAAGGS